ncbi:GNAT family N-acetyltransferase [Croceicoccus ponticola]|uniref:GNAT family N-acetyltransferase n=1 Tax=Croceicoccus ponticola TaxID=2217664 RepID=A0A437GZY6_9SPHN|nr:GNAT family N-acetyltransferase [Croceicoccus ponticola]RVQ68931.1 GNAT family N-acetyltransferase [Croceicoccus ponticola]
MKSAILIEPARVTDLPTLDDMIENCYRGDHARMGWTNEADLVGGKRLADGELLTLFASPDTVIFVARQGEDIVGCVTVTDRPPDTAYIGLLCVDPPFQSAGLGNRLLATAEMLCRNLGVARARMTVIESRDSLVEWYLRQGYAPTGEREPFPVPQPEPLFFTVLEKPLGKA